MKKLKVLLVCPNELRKELEIENTLKAKQELVEGLIEVFYIDDKEDICLICNEEGKIHSLKPNRFIGNELIYGNIIVIGDDYEVEDFKSLTRKHIKNYIKISNN